VNFATPVAVKAGTVYVASYFAPRGGYAVDSGAFATQGVDNGPVHLLRDGLAGANGLHAYAGCPHLPGTASYRSSDYWVDVVFSPTSTPPPPPPPTVRPLHQPGQRHRGRELPGRHAAQPVGHHRRGRPHHPGLRHAHEREPRHGHRASR
jgi:hypothetical protein